MTAPRPLMLLLLSAVVAACGPFELLTTDPRPAETPAVETFQDCVRRLRAGFDPATQSEAALARTLRDQCGPTSCDGSCSACIEDADCGPERLCQDGGCTGCPSLSGCVAPAAGLTRLSRNGCPVCKFAPATECLSDADCPGGLCQRGALCADGCERLDCCANVCSPNACREPAPLGCMAMCDDPTIILPECRTTTCRCAEGRWSCDAVPSTVVLDTCVHRER
jgi:hypothetical protein